jgi:hypothetical protein
MKDINFQAIICCYTMVLKICTLINVWFWSEGIKRYFHVNVYVAWKHHVYSQDRISCKIWGFRGGVYEECRQEAIRIEFHLYNMNRDGGFCLSKSWRHVIGSLKLPGHDSGTLGNSVPHSQACFQTTPTPPQPFHRDLESGFVVWPFTNPRH